MFSKLLALPTSFLQTTHLGYVDKVTRAIEHSPQFCRPSTFLILSQLWLFCLKHPNLEKKLAKEGPSLIITSYNFHWKRKYVSLSNILRLFIKIFLFRRGPSYNYHIEGTSKIRQLSASYIHQMTISIYIHINNNFMIKVK